MSTTGTRLTCNPLDAYGQPTTRTFDSMTDADSDATTLSELLSVLDDEHSRTILAATSDSPLSATELSDRCELSPSSIYRRVDRLEQADLLHEQTRLRRVGHHETVYRASLARFELSVRDGSIDWDVEREDDDDATDQLTRLWGRL